MCDMEAFLWHVFYSILLLSQKRSNNIIWNSQNRIFIRCNTTAHALQFMKWFWNLLRIQNIYSSKCILHFVMLVWRRISLDQRAKRVKYSIVISMHATAVGINYTSCWLHSLHLSDVISQFVPVFTARTWWNIWICNLLHSVRGFPK